jgi:hypothetical protein
VGYAGGRLGNREMQTGKKEVDFELRWEGSGTFRKLTLQSRTA